MLLPICNSPYLHLHFLTAILVTHIQITRGWNAGSLYQHIRQSMEKLSRPCDAKAAECFVFSSNWFCEMDAMLICQPNSWSVVKLDFYRNNFTNYKHLIAIIQFILQYIFLFVIYAHLIQNTIMIKIKNNILNSVVKMTGWWNNNIWH
jgi:hypothetical protein